MAHTPHDAGPAPGSGTTFGLRRRGRWPLPAGKRVAILGARRATPYGEAVAQRLATDLARAGIIVVAGLLPGVENAAHDGALIGGGCTVAVLGTGVDIVVPVASQGVADRVLGAGGALISPFSDGARPGGANFIRRSWTIAELADLVVVVEAGRASVALFTAQVACMLGKTVMAVPGSVFSPLSTECHNLIVDGAVLVRNARDILNELVADMTDLTSQEQG
jgi:DNA processing protein